MSNHPGDSTENKKEETRKALTEDLFNDFYKNRWRVFGMNFMRGVFFGVGSIIGGTLVIALILGLLSMMVDLPSGIGDFVQFIVDKVEGR